MLYNADDDGKSYRESLTALHAHELAEILIKLADNFNGHAKRSDPFNNDERSLQSAFDEMGSRYKNFQLGDNVYANKIVNALSQLSNEEAMDMEVVALAVKDIKVPRKVAVEKQRSNPFIQSNNPAKR